MLVNMSDDGRWKGPQSAREHIEGAGAGLVSCRFYSDAMAEKPFAR